MSPRADQTDEGQRASDTVLDFEGRRAQAAVMSRLTGRDAPVRVGRYHVLHPLGQGGFATVYEGLDPELGRKVAIKILRASQDSKEHSAQERLVREARALAQLEHANVVRIFDVGFHKLEQGLRAVYIVMELLSGKTLEQWCRDDSPTLGETLAAYRAAARGLRAGHAAGIVHRDFKPANAMFSGDGVIKVVDFGLAVVDESLSDSSSESQRIVTGSLTQTGTVMGTPRYMSPEQHRAQPATERSDQYALGVAIWEGVTRSPPFDGETAARLGLQKEAGPPPRPPTLPRWLYAALARALHPQPQRRFASIEAFEAALRAPRRGWWIAGPTLAGAAVVAAVASIPETHALCDAPPPGWHDRFDLVLAHVTPRPEDPRWGVQERLANRLDRFANGWTAAVSQVCTAPGPPSVESERTVACLEQASTRMSTLIAAVLAADAPTERTLVRPFFAIPRPQRCLSGDSGPEAFIVDPQRERQLDHFSDVVSEWSTTDRIVPRAELDATFDAGDALGDVWTSCSLLRARTFQHARAGRLDDAAEDARQAVWRAEAAQDFLLAAELSTAAISMLMDTGAEAHATDAMVARADELIERAGAPVVPRVNLLAIKALLQAQRGDNDRAQALAKQAVDLAGEPPRPGTRPMASLALAMSYTLQPSALTTAEREAGLRRVLAMGDGTEPWYSTGATLARYELAIIARDRGDLDASASELFAALALGASETTEPTARAMYILAEHGVSLADLGSDIVGLAIAEHAYNWIHDTVGSIDGQLETIALDLVEANMSRGEYGEALRWARRELEHAKRLQPDREAAWVGAMVSIARAQGHLPAHPDTEASARAALAVAEEHGVASIAVHLLRGETHARHGALAKAQAELERAAALCRDEGHDPRPGTEGVVRAALAGVLAARGDAAGASQQTDLAIESLRTGNYWHRRRADALAGR